MLTEIAGHARTPWHDMYIACNHTRHPLIFLRALLSGRNGVRIHWLLGICRNSPSKSICLVHADVWKHCALSKKCTRYERTSAMAFHASEYIVCAAISLYVLTTNSTMQKAKIKLLAWLDYTNQRTSAMKFLLVDAILEWQVPKHWHMPEINLYSSRILIVCVPEKACVS